MHSVNGSVITITRQGAAEELTFEVTGGRKSRSEVRNETRLHHQRVKSSGHSTAQKLPQHRAVWGVHKKSERVRKRPSKWENAALYQTFCQKPHFTWNKTKNDNERKGKEIKINTEDESRNYNETSGTQSNESLIPQRHHLVLLHLLPIYSTMTGKIPSAVKSICPLLTYMFKLKSWFGLSVRSWSVFPLPVPESRLRPLCSHSVHLTGRSSSSLSSRSSPGHLLPHSIKSAPVLLQSVLVHALVQYSPLTCLSPGLQTMASSVSTFRFEHLPTCPPFPNNPPDSGRKKGWTSWLLTPSLPPIITALRLAK